VNPEDTLRALHKPGQPLVLPNAWDAGTAKLVAAAGFPAVATSSAAVANSLGYEDNEQAPVEEMFAAAARIVRAVTVPVTVDVESGYGLRAEHLVERLLKAGAAGCNIEDTDHHSGGLASARAQAGRLAAIRAAADAAGVPLVLNARIDVFRKARIAGSGAAEADLLPEAIRRAKAYFDAGVDCVYPILLRQADSIRAFVEAVDGRPVNTMYFASAPDPARAAELGVARVSWGSGVYQAHNAWLGEHLKTLLTKVPAATA
jgi:2-methylisocitrate lyase-like PEP mutase family enzyme